MHQQRQTELSWRLKTTHWIRQSRIILGILTFSKICEAWGTWMVCLPSWMRWGLAWPVRGILIITTALVTHIKTLFHLKIIELLFFLWETSKCYTSLTLPKRQISVALLCQLALMPSLLEQFAIFAHPNVHDIFLHLYKYSLTITIKQPVTVEIKAPTATNLVEEIWTQR